MSKAKIAYALLLTVVVGGGAYTQLTTDDAAVDRYNHEMLEAKRQECEADGKHKFVVVDTRRVNYEACRVQK